MAETMSAGAYVVIPSYIFYSPGMTDGERWLYGYVSSHSTQRGYCWATNDRIAADWGVSVRTVERTMRALRDKGFVCQSESRTGGKVRRKIWLTDIVALRKFITERPDKNVGSWPDKNVGSLYSNNNINNNNPPISPKGGRKRAPRNDKNEVVLPDDLEQRWQRFWSAWPRKQAKQPAREVWYKLSPSDELVDTIVAAVDKLKTTDQWSDVRHIPNPDRFLRQALWEDAELVPDVDTGRTAGGVKLL